MFYGVSRSSAPVPLLTSSQLVFLRISIASHFIPLLIIQPELGELHIVFGDKIGKSVMVHFSSFLWLALVSEGCALLFFRGRGLSGPGCLCLLREMNDHQKPTAGDVKGISCSLPRAGYLPDLRVFNRVKESVKKKVGAYLLEFKSKLQLEHACVA